MLGCWWQARRGTARSVGRFPACLDAGGAAHRTGADQGADRHHRGSRALFSGPSTLSPPRRSITSGTAISRPLYLYVDPDPVHPVRVVGPCDDQPASAARPRPAGVPAISRRADRNLDADGRAGAAHQQHGAGGGARLRDADRPISSSSFSRRCGWISGYRPLPASSPRPSCSAWRCFIIPPRRPIRRPTLLSRRAQPDRPDLRRARGRGRCSVAPAIRGQHCGRDRARPRHQPVRPARLAAGGRTADGRRRTARTATSAASR